MKHCRWLYSEPCWACRRLNLLPARAMAKAISIATLEGLDIEGFQIPVDQSSTLLVPYRGRQGSFPYVSATDVLNGVVDVEKLKDKIVIVGTSAAGLLDLRVTPVQNVYAGVEVHANILSGLLDQTIKSRPSNILGLNWLNYC